MSAPPREPTQPPEPAPTVFWYEHRAFVRRDRAFVQNDADAKTAVVEAILARVGWTPPAGR